MMYLLQQVVTRKYINIFGKINAEYICTFNCAKKHISKLNDHWWRHTINQSRCW